MSAFLYEALDAQGRKTQGVIEADSPRSARAALRAQGMVPVHVQAASLPGGKGLQRVIWRAPASAITASRAWRSPPMT